MLKVVAILFAFSGIAAAQGSVQMDVGVRGGVFLNGYVQPSPCSGVGCFLSSQDSLTNSVRGTVGLAVGTVINDRIDVRFEVIRWNFGDETRSDRTYPELHFVSTTRGHAWEYPLLLAYRFGHGASRPFAGGGMGIAGSASYTRNTQSTSVIPPVTTTTSTSASFTSSSRALYVFGGLNIRTRHLSIRPELRYRHFDERYRAGDIVNPHQFEFVIGLSVPFDIK